MGQFPEEYPQFINEIRFQKAEFSPFFGGFLHLVKMRIFKKKIASLESLFLLLSESVIFFLIAFSFASILQFKKREIGSSLHQ